MAWLLRIPVAGVLFCLFMVAPDLLLAQTRGLVWGVPPSTLLPVSTSRAIAGGVAKMEAGYGQNFFIKQDGTLWAMGYNSNGQLGDGTTTNRSTPVQVATDVATVSASWFQTCHRTQPAQLHPSTSLQIISLAENRPYNQFGAASGDIWASGRPQSSAMSFGAKTYQRNLPLRTSDIFCLAYDINLSHAQIPSDDWSTATWRSIGRYL